MSQKKGCTPWNKGKKCPSISKGRLERKKRLGYINSPETRKKIGEAGIGRIPWNKGKRTKGTPHTEESKKKISIARKKIGVPWNIGRKYSKERCKNISNGLKGNQNFKGKNHNQKTKQKMSISAKKRNNTIYQGKNHWNWQNGKSFEPYGLEFNKQLKEQVRKRDNYRCQECFRHQDKLYDKNKKKYSLIIHHIDYDKNNNNENNLISLCRSCHLKTNRNRESWINYFNNKNYRDALNRGA